MDNILKLTVGCLGVVGLIVMMVPNSDPLAVTGATNTPSISGTAPISDTQAPPSSGFQTEQKKPSEFVVDDYNIGSFGEPMVDPTPPAQRTIIAQQRQVQEQRQIDNGYNNQLPVGQGNFNQPQAGGTMSTRPVGPLPLPSAAGN